MASSITKNYVDDFSPLIDNVSLIKIGNSTNFSTIKNASAANITNSTNSSFSNSSSSTNSSNNSNSYSNTANTTSINLSITYPSSIPNTFFYTITDIYVSLHLSYSEDLETVYLVSKIGLEFWKFNILEQDGQIFI